MKTGGNFQKDLQKDLQNQNFAKLFKKELQILKDLGFKMPIRKEYTMKAKKKKKPKGKC